MNKTIKLDFLTSNILIFTLFLYILFSMTGISILATLGKYAFIGLMAAIFVLLMNKKIIGRKVLKLFLPFFLFTSVYIFNLDIINDSRGLMIVLNQLFYLMIMYIFSFLRMTKNQTKVLSMVYYLTVPFLILFLFVFPGILNTNTIASFAYFLSFFPLFYLVKTKTSYKQLKIFIVLSLTTFLVLAADARSILLSMVFGLATYLFWDFITKKKIRFNLYFFMIAAINYFTIVIYPNLYKWKHFNTINNWSLALTDKPIMTGRNTIWSQLLDLISIEPIFGHGSGVVPEDFLTTSLSAHNLYLQVGLQVGVVGVLLLVLFFFVIWKNYWKNNHDPRVKLIGSFFISIIIHQTFEVTLTQNQFSIGLIQWIIIALGLNHSLGNRKNNQTEP